jgi:hypothetical protein
LAQCWPTIREAVNQIVEAHCKTTTKTMQLDERGLLN